MKESIALCGYSPSSGKFLFVSALPGDGGVDWEWSQDRKKAMALTPHWQRRFAAMARHMNLRGWFCSPVGEYRSECPCGSGSFGDYEGPLRDCPMHGESTPGDYYDQKRRAADEAAARGDKEALERARYVGD